MKKNRFIHFVVISFNIFVLGYFYLFGYGYLESFDNKIRDLYFVLHGQKEPSSKVVIVDIDEKSLRELGQWPWERDKIATILQKITNKGALAIGLDIVFAEEDKTSLAYINRVYNLHLKNPKDNDAVLAQSVASTPTILGYFFDLEGNIESNDDGFGVDVPAMFIEINKPADSHYIIEAQSIVRNIEKIQDAAYSSGFFNNIPDSDGIIRSVPLLMQYNETLYPSLSLELIRAVYGANKVHIVYDANGVAFVRLLDVNIPTDRFGRLFVNYRGSDHKFKYISASDIYYDRVDAKELQNKIVLMGTSAAGIMDLRATPYDNSYPGVEVHATIIDNILEEDFISRPSNIESVELLALLLTFVVFYFLFIFLDAFFLFFALVVGFILVYAVTDYLLFDKHVLLNLIYFYIALLAAFVSASLISFFFVSKQKDRIKKKFESKVSKAVVEEILKSDDNVLQGKEKEITILFSDVRSFTSISESLGSAQKLIALLNAYMTPMVEIIIKYHGTIDKFIGDAIMAYWNAPVDIANHKTMAVESAIQQIQSLEKLNKKLLEKFGLTIDIGIGINTGIATVGEMGSQGRSDFTVIGDSVNLASRLEGLNKMYGTHIIISEFTKEGLDPSIVVRDLDFVQVKGKENAVEIFEVLSYEDRDLDLYHKALHLYRKEAFADSLALFEKLYKEDPKKVYTLYIERNRHYITTQEPFSLIFRLDHK